MHDPVQGLPSLPSYDIYLAYDGSINSDWVFRYAVNMAANSESKKINLIHIEDGAFSREAISQKVDLIAEECLNRGVAFSSTIYPLSGNNDVYAALLKTIPKNTSSLCICGARITSRGRGYLAGTISEKLLRCRKFNVFAVRVVKPGILGLPRELLFPLSGHPRGLQAAMSFFLLMMPQVTRLYLLRVMQVRSFWFQYMSGAQARSRRQTGTAYMERILEDLRVSLEGIDVFIDGKVVLSDDWVKEILVHADKVKAQLIIMGASDRYLPSRYFYWNKIERIMRHSSCDVAIYRKI